MCFCWQVHVYNDEASAHVAYSTSTKTKENASPGHKVMDIDEASKEADKKDISGIKRSTDHKNNDWCLSLVNFC